MADENDKIDGAAGAGDDKGKDPPVDRGDEVKSPLDEAGKGGEGDDAGKDGAAKGDRLDEGDETPEEKAEREKQEAEEAKKRNIRIPKSRFDEAQAKARQREQALLEAVPLSAATGSGKEQRHRAAIIVQDGATGPFARSGAEAVGHGPTYPGRTWRRTSISE